MKFLFYIFTSLYCITINAQNLFPKKLDNCITDRFCLDCGDEKAEVDKSKMDVLAKSIVDSGVLKGMKGTVKFQVLIDSTGTGCVLSHSDTSEHPLTKELVKKLNAFDGWIPAKDGGRIERKVSVNLSAKVDGNTIEIKIERVDMDAFEKSFDHPNDPEIFNKKYKYSNKHLENYIFTVWNSKNKDIINNKVDHIALNKKGDIWFTVDEGLYRREEDTFINSEQNITDKGKYFGYFELAIDNNETVWVNCSKGIYSCTNGKWTKYDDTVIGIKTAYNIINNPLTGDVFFCSDKGLTIYKNGEWNILDMSRIKELPSNRVNFAKRDSKGRLWIGTFSGSVMVDTDGKITTYNNTKTALKGQCITSMAEDEKGNLYFGLFEFDGKKGEVNRNEGIAVLSNGKWKQYTTENSGMPFNHTTGLAYDTYEKVLWIATDRAGLIRYDLKDGWENYHNLNSAIPTSYISEIEYNNGKLWLGTHQGLVKIEINESMIRPDKP